MNRRLPTNSTSKVVPKLPRSKLYALLLVLTGVCSHSFALEEPAKSNGNVLARDVPRSAAQAAQEPSTRDRGGMLAPSAPMPFAREAGVTHQWPLPDREQAAQYPLTHNGFMTTTVAAESVPSASDAKTKNKPNEEQQRFVGHQRAGCPQAIRPWASVTYDSNYQGYYVGGGVPPGRDGLRGELRRTHEGIWGMDYAPRFTRVALNWSHGRLFQGGIGQYEPDRLNRPTGETFGRNIGPVRRGLYATSKGLLKLSEKKPANPHP